MILAEFDQVRARTVATPPITAPAAAEAQAAPAAPVVTSAN
jgi:hypothetical protein